MVWWKFTRVNDIPGGHIGLRILVIGASGSGTTTLGREIAAQLDYDFVDADDAYWVPTEPLYSVKRSSHERRRLMLEGLETERGVVVAGSVVGWGEAIEDAFDWIVFLMAAARIRIERLRQREIRERGAADPAFLTWAAGYDEGGLETRSLATHEQWLSQRRCPVLRIDGTQSFPAVLELALAFAAAFRPHEQT